MKDDVRRSNQMNETKIHLCFTSELSHAFLFPAWILNQERFQFCQGHCWQIQRAKQFFNLKDNLPGL